MNLEAWQLALMWVGALLVGVSKTGIAGLGMLFVAIFAQIMPAKQSSGFVLPLLIFGDLVAVISYRQHANWKHVWKLFPSAAAGVVLGFFAMARINDREARLLIGTIVCTMVALHLLRRWRAARALAAGRPPVDTTPGYAAAVVIGVLAGFTTLIANAAGPLMAIYLLAMRLPKMEYVGTGAVFFLMLNLFKVPFMIALGLVTPPSFQLNLFLAPAVLAGAWLGRLVLKRIDQKVFETLILLLALISGVKLLF